MKDLILLHGALSSKEQLEPLRKKLKQQKLNPLSFNFFGHGGEAYSKEGFGIKVFSWQLQNFIRENKLKQPHVFGYSMGGYVALRLACKFPDTLGNITTLGTKFDWTPPTAKKEIENLNPKKIAEKLPALAESLKKLHAPNDWKDLLAKTADMLKSLGKEPLLTDREFSEIDNKVVICLGDQDNMVTREESEKAAEALPDGKFVLLEKTPHLLEKADVSMLAEVILGNLS